MVGLGSVDLHTETKTTHKELVLQPNSTPIVVTFTRKKKLQSKDKQ